MVDPGAGGAAEPTRVIVVGSGSAGRRHATTLREELRGARIAMVRRAESAGPTEELDALGVHVVSTIDDAVEWLGGSVDLGVVAGPATLHRAQATALIAAGAHLLVEKPLAHTLADSLAIAAAAEAAGRHVLVGYHLRFGDVFSHLLAAVAAGAAGRPCSYDLAVGQHLAQWRPGTDPRASVSAHAELGGGVLLELSHEIDVAAALGGPIIEVTSAALRTDGAPTDGFVDTVADLELRMESDAAVTVHLDMISPIPFRRWEVAGDEASVVADVLTGEIHRHADGLDPELLYLAPPGERDRAERRLVEHLVDVARGAPARCTVADGIAAVAVVEAARATAVDGVPRRVHQPDHR